MGRSKSTGPTAAAGNHAKERHRKDKKGNYWDWNKTPPPGLIATLDKPQVKFKHRVELEFVENTNRKKKLEFEFYKSRHPPPLFEFVPIGNPDFTDLCKEISRERGAMIYIVAPLYHGDSKQLSVHTHRIGHHFRQAIVEEARQQLKVPIDIDLVPGEPEPIPETQAEINKEAEKHIMELFPRIPNPDRQMIIDHAFNLSKKNDRDPPVGLAKDIPLTSRVQLAVLAHIRHTHTRYDQLLRETDWASARKVCEPVCLDILVKWRGDEESGRDQLDEILREVIYINSDSESDDDDEDDSETDDELSDSPSALVSPGFRVEVEGGLDKATTVQPTAVPDRQRTAPLNPAKEDAVLRQPRTTRKVKKRKNKKKKGPKRKTKFQRGLSRYQAAWEQAQERRRCEEANEQARSPDALPTVMNRAAGYGSSLPRYAPYPAFHDLDAPINNREVLRYDDPPPTRLPVTAYHHQGSRAEAARFYDEVKPIVGSPVTRDAGIVVRRTRNFEEDLKDHLVKSIEPTSPDVLSFPAQSFGQPHWEQHRIRSAPEVQYDGGHQASAGYSGLRRNPEYLDPHPRDQLLVNTGFSSQHIVPVTSQPTAYGRTFSSPGASIAPGTAFPTYREVPPTGPARSDARVEPPRVIWIDDDDGDDALLRTKARPIVIQDEYGEAQQVMVDTRQPQTTRAATDAQYHDSDRVDVYRTRVVERRIEPAGYDMSQDFSDIVRVSNKFPRRHEPQHYAADVGGPAHRSPAPLYYQQDAFHGDPMLPRHSHPAPRARVERVIAMVEEPLRQYPYQTDVARQPVSVSYGVQRQEWVVGHEYVSTAAHDGGVRRFTSPVLRTEAGGGGHWSRPASAMPPSPNPNPNANNRLASVRDYRREDGVIELN
ncbi:hypothetical protein QBC37DRAFT_100620 [Rhypophila decipiens]|uniref:DUF2293 domain-containing protein n=1 Tax=Rhypophila decipiens TaxID=261697 RepID=A0AAN7BA48_9PEZI|nr:hypothetical protein QBC37DRAFT_100620 [Rhypophila decipiens]